MIIACVLKSGGDFRPEHVLKLRRMVAKHAPAHLYDFVCLTDSEVDCQAVPLTEGWPGWWSKMELFKLPGPLLYLDLDTIIVGDLVPILEAVPKIKFGILRDFYRGASNRNAMGSGVMCWSGDQRRIYWGFHYRRPEPGGDQIYLEKVIREPTFLQDQFPGAFVSFKADKVQANGTAPEVVAVCFHGRPRPWEQDRIPY